MTYDYHVVTTESPLTFKELSALGIHGWALFSVRGPESPAGGRWEHNFRRPASAPSHVRPNRGGVDGTGPRFGDLIGRFADAVPISLKGRSWRRG
jgi:hypothetical protein